MDVYFGVEAERGMDGILFKRGTKSWNQSPKAQEHLCKRNVGPIGHWALESDNPYVSKMV